MTSERNRERITFDEVVTQAKATILKDNFHSPILILEGNKTSLVHLISDMPETHGERLALMSVLGSSIAKSGRPGQLLQVFSVTEGWLSISPKGQLPAKKPSLDPYKKDVLVIAGLDKERQKKYLKFYEILRDEKRKVVNLIETRPEADQEKIIDVPLLDAFVQGFQATQ